MIRKNFISILAVCSILISSCSNSGNNYSQDIQVKPSNTTIPTESKSESSPTQTNTSKLDNQEIDKNKPQIGIIKDMQNGDLKCYVTIVDENGKIYESIGAEFDICTPEKYVKKKVRMSYELGDVNDCQSAEPCGKTIKEWLIHKIEILEDKSPNSSNQDSTSASISKTKKPLEGEYCYKAKTDTLSATAKIKITAASKVDGSIQATIQNPAEGYFSSYNQSLTGELEGDQAKLKVITKIENDTQNKQETWTISESSLNTGLESFSKVDCANLEDL